VEVLDITGGAVAGMHEIGEETSSGKRLRVCRVHVHDIVDSQRDEHIVSWCAIYLPVAMDTNVAAGCNQRKAFW